MECLYWAPEECKWLQILVQIRTCGLGLLTMKIVLPIVIRRSHNDVT